MKKHSFYKTFNGEYSQEGYEEGLEDAKSAKPKNKYKFFKAVNPINLLWNTNNAYNSFAQNYEKGYLDGQRVKNDIYNNKLIPQGANMDDTSYDYFIKILDELEESMSLLKKPLLNMDDKYEQQINLAHNAGFVDNYIEPLKIKREKFRVKIEELVAEMEKHKESIEEQKELIEELKRASEDY